MLHNEMLISDDGNSLVVTLTVLKVENWKDFKLLSTNLEVSHKPKCKSFLVTKVTSWSRPQSHIKKFQENLQQPDIYRTMFYFKPRVFADVLSDQQCSSL